MITQCIIQNPAAIGQNSSPERAGKGGQEAERRSLETSGNPEKQKVSRNSYSMSDSDSDLSKSLFQIQIQIQNSQTREIEVGRVGLGKVKAGKQMSGPHRSMDQEQQWAAISGNHHWAKGTRKLQKMRK